MSNLEQKLLAALKQAVKDGFDLDADESVLLIETPKDPKLGDYASSTAMKLARTLRQNPLVIAEALAVKLRELLPEAESVTVARPGFLESAGPFGGVEAGGIESRRSLAVGFRIQLADGKIPFALGIGAVDAPVQEDAQPVLGELLPRLQISFGRDIGSLGVSRARKEHQRGS